MADGETPTAGAQALGGGPRLQRDRGRLTRLYCMNGGHHLQIRSDGTVRGQRDEGDQGDAHSESAVHGAFYSQIRAVDRGVVVIQGTEAGRYLAMSDEGRLYSSLTATEECHFLEKLEENHYNTYQAQKHQEENWYVALKKNGKPKLGPRTHIGQKAVFFLPRRLDDSGE